MAMTDSKQSADLPAIGSQELGDDGQPPTPNEPADAVRNEVPEVQPADAELLREIADMADQNATEIEQEGYEDIQEFAVRDRLTAARLRALAAERERIDVGYLRTRIAVVAGRLREQLPRSMVDDALGTEGTPATDFAEAFRELLSAAQLRITLDEHGYVTAHDLLL